MIVGRSNLKRRENRALDSFYVTEDRERSQRNAEESKIEHSDC